MEHANEKIDTLVKAKLGELTEAKDEVKKLRQELTGVLEAAETFEKEAQQTLDQKNAIQTEYN